MKIGPLSSGSAPGAFRVVVPGIVFHCGTAREAAALAVLLRRADIAAETTGSAEPPPVSTAPPQGQHAAGPQVAERLARIADALPKDGAPLAAKAWYSRFLGLSGGGDDAAVSFSRFQDHMAQLVARGVVVKSGRRRGTRYERGRGALPAAVPATPAPAPPTCAKCGRPRSAGSGGLCRACYLEDAQAHAAAAPVPAKGAARPAAAPAPPAPRRVPQGRPVAVPPQADSIREGAQAELARQVLALLADGKARTFREIRTALKCGGSTVLAITQALQATRQIVRRDMGTPAYYQLPSEAQRLAGPQARSVAVQPVTDRRLAPVVARVFLSGASYDIREIHRTAQRGVPEATLAQVTALVDAMVREGKLARVPLGSITRYQQRARSGKGVLSDVEAADLATTD